MRVAEKFAVLRWEYEVVRVMSKGVDYSTFRTTDILEARRVLEHRRRVTERLEDGREYAIRKRPVGRWTKVVA